MQEKALTSMHSVGLEPAKLILIGTQTTYQATADAGMRMYGDRVCYHSSFTASSLPGKIVILEIHGKNRVAMCFLSNLPLLLFYQTNVHSPQNTPAHFTCLLLSRYSREALNNARLKRPNNVSTTSCIDPASLRRTHLTGAVSL